MIFPPSGTVEPSLLAQQGPMTSLQSTPPQAVCRRARW
jgi:hypothetical protein